jgi:hypothetical protein
MLKTATTSTARPHLPALADRLTAELLSLLPEPQPGEPDLDFPSFPEVAALPASETTRTPGLTPAAHPILNQAALHGLAGRAVRTIAPHTEAHPASLLLQLLAVFGNLAGPGPHCMVNATRHCLNLYVILVGDSGKARKGTSWNQIARLFAEVDQPWLSTRVTSARLTASGLVQALRDQQPPTDRRLLALSEEFASVLHTLKRGNGHLSPLLRSAWDSGSLPALDVHHPPVTQTHISLIAHITQRELAHNLTRTEAQNGFANRCLWACVQRSNCLPEGGSLSHQELASLARELRSALDWAAATPEILFRRDAAARDLWAHCYPTLSQLQPGFRGAATSRGEAQVLRLSAIYAALDSTSVIGVPHLQAALALWDYCYASASLLFGFSTGDPIADRIREAIEASGKALSKFQITRLFHGHVEGDRIDAALETLFTLGHLHKYSVPTGGRPSTLWTASEEPEYPQEESIAGDASPMEDESGGF